MVFNYLYFPGVMLTMKIWADKRSREGDAVQADSISQGRCINLEC